MNSNILLLFAIKLVHRFQVLFYCFRIGDSVGRGLQMIKLVNHIAQIFRLIFNRLFIAIVMLLLLLLTLLLITLFLFVFICLILPLLIVLFLLFRLFLVRLRWWFGCLLLGGKFFILFVILDCEHLIVLYTEFEQLDRSFIIELLLPLG